jgi:hypothetical protein
MRPPYPHGISELTLSRIWQDGTYARELRTTDGRRVAVVYGGVWTHANGPDFRDALLDIAGRLVSGAVELHLRSSDWFRHGHQRDVAYDNVVLHIVLTDDLSAPAHGPGGRPIPTICLGDFLTMPIDDLAGSIAQRPLGSLGVETCLPTLAGGRIDLVRGVLRREGWRRLVEKQLRFAQLLELLPAGEVLYRGLLDGLGLMQNRAGMAAVAERLPLAMLEAGRRERAGLLAVLLGTGGFLPLAPAHAALAELDGDSIVEIERAWTTLAGDLAVAPLPATVWSLNRVRPANHPVRRLATFAGLLATTGRDGLLATVLSLPLDAGAAWLGWLESVQPRIGRERAQQIVVNVLAPFLAAYAGATGDDGLAERAGQLWEVLPGAADDSVARGTLRQIVGANRVPIRLAIEAQGLHQIGRHGCRELRCFDCPIAMLALEYEPGYVLREDG